MEPTSTAYTVEIIGSALAAHRDSLIEHGVEQLTRLWAQELDGMSPELVAEVVASRLSSSSWNHFKRPGGAAAKPSAQAPGELPVGFGSRTPQVVANSERIGAQILANRAAALQGAAPGLAGNYGR